MTNRPPAVNRAFTDPSIVTRFAKNADRAIREGYYLRGKLFIDMARSMVPEGGHILDYGCGPGRIGMMLAEAGFRVQGVDPSPEMIAKARVLSNGARNINFEIGSEDSLETDRYDAIVCSSVIEYVPDAEALMRTLHRSLRQDGVLLISYANTRSLWRWYWHRNSKTYNPFQPAACHLWTPNGFRNLLRKNGFRPITRPKFFEPAYERWFGPLLLCVPLVGSLGIVAARRMAEVAGTCRERL
jgi:SAM-dependent methyltransferase